GDCGARHPGDLVQGPLHQHPDAGRRSAPVHTPLRSLLRIASAQRTNPSAPMPITDAIAFSSVVTDQPLMIGSRIPLTMKLNGLYCATQEAGSSIKLAGKKASERKRTTKTRGKIPCTTLALFDRRAIAAPIVPKARAEAEVSAMIQMT